MIGVMKDNISKVMERGEKLDDLEEKSGLTIWERRGGSGEEGWGGRRDRRVHLYACVCKYGYSNMPSRSFKVKPSVQPMSLHFAVIYVYGIPAEKKKYSSFITF